MSKVQITFVFNKDTDEITDLQVTPISNAKASNKGAFVNTNNKIELKGSSLILNNDVLVALKAKVDSKLVLTVEVGVVTLSNPKYDSTLKGGNKVTGKNTISCRGAIKDALEAIGSTFAFTVVKPGVINLILTGENEDVLQIQEETDDVISTEDIASLYNNDEEELSDDFTFDNK